MGTSGNIAVIAPGTGLGEAFLVHTTQEGGGEFLPCATEGGGIAVLPHEMSAK